MRKVYKANRSGLMRYVLIVLFLLPVGIMVLDKHAFTERPAILLPLAAPLVLGLWIYFDTYYTIENGKLKYKSAFIKGNVDILKIREISQGKTLSVGKKPALASGGLIIRYNEYDDVYVAPESNEELIADLLKINGSIKVVE